MTAQDGVIRVTPSAREAVIAALEDEPNSSGLALCIEVVGASGETFTYDVYFEERSIADEKDALFESDGFWIYVPGPSIEKIEGSTLDLDPTEGLVIINPNTPRAAVEHELGPESRTSEIALRVIDVLADSINPSIAAHGGRADLEGVVDGVAYLRLSGGCQGCGLAAVTLSQGISVAIKEFIPEIIDVVDVTDHASGSDPFFTGAKK